MTLVSQISLPIARPWGPAIAGADRRPSGSSPFHVRTPQRSDLVRCHLTVVQNQTGPTRCPGRWYSPTGAPLHRRHYLDSHNEGPHRAFKRRHCGHLRFPFGDRLRQTGPAVDADTNRDRRQITVLRHRRRSSQSPTRTEGIWRLSHGPCQQTDSTDGGQPNPCCLAACGQTRAIRAANSAIVDASRTLDSACYDADRHHGPLSPELWRTLRLALQRWD